MTQLDLDVVTARAGGRARVEAARRRERRRQARLTATLAVFAVLSGFLVAFASQEAEFSGDAFGALASGVLEKFDEADQSWGPIEVGEEISFQTVVRTPVDAEATLRVRTGEVSLAPASLGTLLPGQVELQHGAVLFEVSAFYLGMSDALIARGDGHWRLDAAPNPRVAVYQGTASVTGGLLLLTVRSEARTLRRFEEVRLDQDVLTEAAPLTYRVDDPWDARLAADLLAIDAVVAQTREGIARTYGTDPRPEDFYTAFTAVDDGIELALERFDTRPGPGYGPPADVLIAVLVSRLLVESVAIGFPEAIDEVDTIRAAGGTWGFILVRRDLTAADFVRSLDLSLRAIAELGDQAPRPRPRPTASPAPSPSPSPTSRPSPLPTPRSTPTPTDEPTIDPTEPTGPVPSECDDPAATPVSCAQAGVDELLRIIDELIPPLPAMRSAASQLGLFLVDVLSSRPVGSFAEQGGGPL